MMLDNVSNEANDHGSSKPEPVVDIVRAAAIAALEKALGNQQDAAKILINRVRQEKLLRQAILEPLIEYACSNAISLAIRANRERVWRPSPGLNSTDQQARVKALAADNLLMFPLPGGLALGMAGRAEVTIAADFYGKQAKDMGHKFRWLALVAQSIPDGKRASDVLSNARLRELEQEAANAE